MKLSIYLHNAYPGNRAHNYNDMHSHHQHIGHWTRMANSGTHQCFLKVYEFFNCVFFFDI